MEQELKDKIKAENPNLKLRLISAEHDDIVLECVFALPSEELYRLVQQHAVEGRDKQANEVLLYSCLKHPAPKEMAAILKEYPVLLDKLCFQVLKLAGASVEFKISKF